MRTKISIFTVYYTLLFCTLLTIWSFGEMSVTPQRQSHWDIIRIVGIILINGYSSLSAKTKNGVYVKEYKPQRVAISLYFIYDELRLFVVFTLWNIPEKRRSKRKKLSEPRTGNFISNVTRGRFPMRSFRAGAAYVF